MKMFLDRGITQQQQKMKQQQTKNLLLARNLKTTFLKHPVLDITKQIKIKLSNLLQLGKLAVQKDMIISQ